MLLSDHIKQLQEIQKAQSKKIEIGVWNYECMTYTLDKDIKIKVETVDRKRVVTMITHWFFLRPVNILL